MLSSGIRETRDQKMSIALDVIVNKNWARNFNQRHVIVTLSSNVFVHVQFDFALAVASRGYVLGVIV